MKKIVNYIFIILSGIFFTKYMFYNSNSKILYLVVFFAFLYLDKYLRVKNIKNNKFEKIMLTIFAIAFSFFLILGSKLVITASGYYGTYTYNYMEKLKIIDFIGFIPLVISNYNIENFIIYLLKKYTKKIKLNNNIGVSKIKYVFLIALLLFTMWLPYFLIYYPGFIFADSINSIKQVLGYAKLSNHYTVLYTFFLSFCINLATLLKKDITIGIAIYTLIQMIYLAFSLSYLICWLKNKGVSKKICIFIILMFGLVPFYANQTITLWRDPIWSISIMLWTLCLIDCIITNGKLLNNYLFLLKNIVLLLLIILFRNNGFFVVLFTLISIILIKLNFKKRTLIIFCTTMVFIYLGILSPIYKKYNIKESFAESIPVLLQQMASTVVNDGNINEKEYDVLNNMLPIYKYKETYRPCVVDLLKWDRDFDIGYIDNNKPLFFKTYLSLLIKNPYKYIQGWGLTTYGYWAFNKWDLNQDTYNIVIGDLNKIDRESYGIKKKNFLENKYFDFTKIFTTRDSFISLPIINWCIFLICILLIIFNNKKWIIALAPSLGVIFSLLIATPYYYWARYGLAEYYLLPVYIIIMIYGLKRNN